MTDFNTANDDDDDDANCCGADSILAEAAEQRVCLAIERGNDWDTVEQLLRANSVLCKKRHRRNGYTILHWLCSIGATPVHLIDVVASLYPAAISMIDTNIGDTCLHIACRNSQFSSAKLRALLRHCKDADATAAATLLVRNRMGGTALHSAVHHNAVLDAIQLLVTTHPPCVLVKTHEGISVITALWSSFLQTIQGHLFVARALKGEADGTSARENSQMIDRFWCKLEYLGLQVYRLHEEQKATAAAATTGVPQRPSPILCTREFLLHGLLRCAVPLKLFLLCLQLQPQCAAAVSSDDGNTPLHVLLATRPYRSSKEREAVQAVVAAAPQTVTVRNHNGDLPLHVALRNRIPYEHGIDLLLQQQQQSTTAQDNAAASVSEEDDQRDRHTGLFPFLLAAEQGGRVAINTTFQLLLRRPGEAIGNQPTNHPTSNRS